MTPHDCTDTLEVDGDQTWFTCELPHGHDSHHQATDSETLGGRPFTVTWTRTPDTVIGQVIE